MHYNDCCPIVPQTEKRTKKLFLWQLLALVFDTMKNKEKKRKEATFRIYRARKEIKYNYLLEETNKQQKKI